IASPGEAAIAAAANPPEGDFCWFVTVNLETGETKFTADYQEFLEFREEYQPWREEDGPERRTRMTARSPDSGASAPDGGRAGAPTRTRRNLTILGVLVVALALLVAGAWQLVIPMLRDADDPVTDYPGPGSGEVSVVISDP